MVLDGTLSLICINAGIGLMIDSGMTRGFPGRRNSGNGNGPDRAEINQRPFLLTGPFKQHRSNSDGNKSSIQPTPIQPAQDATGA